MKKFILLMFMNCSIICSLYATQIQNPYINPLTPTFTSLTTTDNLTVNRITFPDGTVQTSSPTAGGGSGASYDDMIFESNDFVPCGFASSATPVGLEIQTVSPFRAVNSSVTIFGVEFLNAPNPNEVIAQKQVPTNWTASATTMYGVAFTTGAITGSYWIDMAVSTNPVSGVWTVGASTVTFANSPAFSDVKFSIIFANNSGISAGNETYLKVERAYGDKVGSSIYVKSIRASKN